MNNDPEYKTLATEILQELKRNAKRWFIAFCVMIFLELATIIGFMWYLSHPTMPDDIQMQNTCGTINYIGKTLNGSIYNGQD